MWPFWVNLFFFCFLFFFPKSAKHNFLSYFSSGESIFVSPKYTKLEEKKKSLEEFTIRLWIVAENKLGES